MSTGLGIGRGGRAMVVAAALALVGCSSEGPDEPSARSIAATCGTIRELHNDLIAIANDMAEREVTADPADRAEILADGVDQLTERVRVAELPEAPVDLVAGLESRRAEMVDEMTANAAAFRAEWTEVTNEDRAAAVPRIFIWLEKISSETKAAVTPDTSAQVVDLVVAESSCDFLVRR